jgi:hypothetical protein
MWAKYKKFGSRGRPTETLEVHIHNAKELNGGENSTGGKFPRHSQTVPLE